MDTSGVDLQLAAQLLVSGVVLGAIYALLALSISVIYATAGVFHFAHGAVYAIGAYAAVLSVAAGVPWPVAAVIGIAAAAVAGTLCEVGIYRPMRRRGATSLSLFISSLGLSIAIPALIQIAFGPENRSLVDLSPKVINIGGSSVSFSTLDIYTMMTCAAAVIGVLVLRSRSRWGMAATAVQTNPQMASAVGIIPERIYALAFCVGSGLMGLAAVLYLLSGTASPNMGLRPVLIGFIGVFFGGMGHHSGAALGGLVLGILTNLSGIWVSQDYADVIVFSALFIVLIARPSGLFVRTAAR